MNDRRAVNVIDGPTRTFAGSMSSESTTPPSMARLTLRYSHVIRQAVREAHERMVRAAAEARRVKSFLAFLSSFGLGMGEPSCSRPK